ncbi:MAG: MBL fold metallo-hydrolase [Clostridiales bacterium]|nr:MBL fold metallo-hydrolase [Clostridiales bacterium]
MQILKGLYQVGGSLNGVTWTGRDASYEDANVYVIKFDGGLILFDCGCGETLDQIFTNMRYWGLSPKDIRACFLTHSHLDHAGGAHILASRGVEIFAHENAAEAIEAGDERCCGYLYHKKFIPCGVDNRLKDKDRISYGGIDINVMHLPGHTSGCAAYVFTYEDRKIVVSGDIIGTLLDGYFGWDGSIDFDKKAYIESLKRFARFDSDIMLPGHGMIYFHKPRRRVEEAFSQALSQWR